MEKDDGVETDEVQSDISEINDF